MKKIIDYFKDHWHGKLGLTASFLVNFIAITYACWQLIKYVCKSNIFNNNSMSFFRLITVLLTLWVIIYIWQLVGCWRTASRISKASETAVTGTVIKLILIVSFLFATPIFLNYKGCYEIATRTDGHSKYSVELSKDEIIIKGSFAWGLEKDVEKILAKNSEIYLINMNSHGGRSGVALELAKLISKYELSTYAICLVFNQNTNIGEKLWLSLKIH